MCVTATQRSRSSKTVQTQTHFLLWGKGSFFIFVFVSVDNFKETKVAKDVNIIDIEIFGLFLRSTKTWDFYQANDFYFKSK